MTVQDGGQQADLPGDTYAVFGNPIKHSKSPQIHKAFAQQLGDALTYRAVRVESDAFESTVLGFFQRGGRGLNITVPFKERACALADTVSSAAEQAGAANCLVPRQAGLHAENTDGLGLVKDMAANLGWQLQGRRALVIGAGGAVRGILQPLLQERVAELIIVNRTASRALELAQRFDNPSTAVRGCAPADVDGETFDLVINGTSASLSDALPELPDIKLSARCCCYDLVYAAAPTAFMQWSAARAAWAVADGLGMLVEQAAESYYLWRGQRPATDGVISDLRAALLASA